MSTELTGRALDEAAARAMGWATMQPEMSVRGVVGWLRPDGCIACLPAYSTDPEHIPEMLAWLRKFGHVTINVPLTESVGAMISVEDLDTFDLGCDGATLSEALARLVVAVKDARR